MLGAIRLLRFPLAFSKALGSSIWMAIAISMLGANRLGWRIVSAMFDRERLIVDTK